MKSLVESIIGSNNASVFINDKYKKFFEYMDKHTTKQEVKRQLRYTIIFTSYELAEQYMSWMGSDDEPSVKVLMDIEKILDRNPKWELLKDGDDIWWYNKGLADRLGLDEKKLIKINK